MQLFIEIPDLVTGSDCEFSVALCPGLSISQVSTRHSDEQFLSDNFDFVAKSPLAKSLTLCITPSLLNDTWKTSGSFCMTISAIWRALVMTLKSFDWSIPPIKLEMGCLLRTTPSRSGGAWHNTLNIAFTHLCLTAGPTEELNILYKAENITQVYDEASLASSHKTTKRSSLLVIFVSSVLDWAVDVSLPPGHRCICLDVPVSSFVCKVKITTVHFNSNSVKWF